MKKQTPILMSTLMVQAILAGRKTVTRRIVKAELDDRGLRYCNPQTLWEDWHGKGVPCPYGKPGDVLWVQETWQPWLRGDGADGSVQLIKYAADNAELTFTWVKDFDDYRNRPGIHMNKEYCRIWLEVTDIRVERLQDISEEDAIAEGIEARWCRCGGQFGHYEAGGETHECLCLSWEYGHGVMAFKELWGDINGAESWAANPWVWVVSFKVLSTTGKPASLEKEEAV